MTDVKLPVTIHAHIREGLDVAVSYGSSTGNPMLAIESGDGSVDVTLFFPGLESMEAFAHQILSASTARRIELASQVQP